jgi:hypothetical protein
MVSNKHNDVPILHGELLSCVGVGIFFSSLQIASENDTRKPVSDKRRTHTHRHHTDGTDTVAIIQAIYYLHVEDFENGVWSFHFLIELVSGIGERRRLLYDDPIFYS